MDFLGRRGFEVPPDYLEMITPMGYYRAAEYTIERFGLNEKPEDFLKYCCFEAYVCAQAAVCLQQKLEETQMDRLMREIEMPLTLVLFSMEEEGIRVNPEALKDYGEALSGKITELEQEIYSEAGCEFNINSP